MQYELQKYQQSAVTIVLWTKLIFADCPSIVFIWLIVLSLMLLLSLGLLMPDVLLGGNENTS